MVDEALHAFVAPAIFVSGGGLLALSLNARLLAIVSRLRAFHKEKHDSVKANKRQEVLILEAQIESIERRAEKVRLSFMFVLIGILGTLTTCLLLGLGVYMAEAKTLALASFVLSILSMLTGTAYFVSEVAISLSSVKDEARLYDILDKSVLDQEIQSGG